MTARDERDPDPKAPASKSQPSRQEEIERVVAEYANDLRESLKKFRRLFS
jgi:hypothetical protein